MNNKLSVIVLTALIFVFSSCGISSDGIMQNSGTSSSEISGESCDIENYNLVNDLKARKITNGYKTVVDEFSEQTMEYLINKDTKGLETLFSDMSNEKIDLDTEIEKAYDFLDGDIISFGEIKSHTGAASLEGGDYTRLTGSSYIYQIKTEKDEFKIYIGCVIINEEDSSQIGIHNIKIKNSKYDIDDPNNKENMLSIGEFGDSWYE